MRNKNKSGIYLTIAAIALILLIVAAAALNGAISAVNTQANEKQKELDRLVDEKGELSQELDFWLSDEGKERIARENGYIYPDEQMIAVPKDK